MLDDGAKAVMASMSTADLYTHRPQWKSEFVMDHDKIRNDRVSVPENRADRPTTVVHIRLRFSQDDLYRIYLGSNEESMMFFLNDINKQAFCKLVDSLKARIMAHAFVLSARVAKTNDDFHLKQAPNHK